MIEIVVVVFDDDRRASEGAAALKTLQVQGSLTLYDSAVIGRNADGSVTSKEPESQEPLAGVVGLVAGIFIGLLGGPAGLVAGAVTGTSAGLLYDAQRWLERRVLQVDATGILESLPEMARHGICRDFFDEVLQKFTPGKAAVIAEIDEPPVGAFDTRMQALGGAVFRRSRSEFVDATVQQKESEAGDTSGLRKAS
jgi:uncharacterized membrane protein